MTSEGGGGREYRIKKESQKMKKVGVGMGGDGAMRGEGLVGRGTGRLNIGKLQK